MKDWILVMKNRGSLGYFVSLITILFAPMAWAVVSAIFPYELYRENLSPAQGALYGYVIAFASCVVAIATLCVARDVFLPILRSAINEYRLCDDELNAIMSGRGELRARRLKGGLMECDYTGDKSGRLSNSEEIK